MATGIPRQTLSLCPDCNREVVEAVVSGETTVAEFRDSPKSSRRRSWKRPDAFSCAKRATHGPFEDVLSNHPAFFKRMESLAVGKDFLCAGDEAVRKHAANSIRTGRGSYLIIDLTSRRNIFCSPCYMDANAACYVHELDIEDVTGTLDRAVSFKPQREVNVPFSGGEMTLSPMFLDAIRQAKSMGFHRLGTRRFARAQCDRQWSG
jgi:7,8-dihydro-6-hydroxymethylpterin dimethyltransferase